jgi:hypothetical protein
MHGPMERLQTRFTTTCRCGYASPATLPRCLGCGRRLVRCERVAAAGVAPAVAAGSVAPGRPASTRRRVPTIGRSAAPVDPSATTPFVGRDAARFGAPPIAASPAVALPTGTLAVLGLVASAWMGPDGPRPELLTAAALLGAGLSLSRAATAATVAPDLPMLILPSRLTDDELREAISAW